MKTAFISSFLALTIAATSAQIISPRFTCPFVTDVAVENEIGGCCESFNDGGVGENCVRADILINGANEEFTCDDSDLDPGMPACCHLIPGVKGRPPILVCQPGPQ